MNVRLKAAVARTCLAYPLHFDPGSSTGRCEATISVCALSSGILTANPEVAEDKDKRLLEVID